MPTLPIKTDHLVMLCGGDPETVTDFATGAPKIDQATGAPLVAVPLVLIVEGRPEVATVKIPGPIPALVVGGPVTVVDLVATTWAMGDRSGVSFRAASITPATITTPAVSSSTMPSASSAASSRSGS